MDTNKTKFTLLLLPFIASVITNTYAQESTSHNEVERIEVVGQIDAVGYKKRAIKAKQDFYALYNEMTQDGMLKVKCKKEIKPGSGKIRITVCEPAFEAKISTRNMPIADRLLQLPDPVREEKIKQYKEKQLDHLLALVNGNDELRSKFLTYVDLVKKYKTKRAE